MPTEQERKINDALAKAVRQYDRLNARQVRFVVEEIARTRLQVVDTLNRYAGSDNTIPKARLASIQRQLDAIEQAIRRYGTTSMRTVIAEAAAASTSAANGAITNTLGASVGLVLGGINENVVQYVATRFADDGLQLSDRVWQLAGDTRDELNRTLRSDIIRGESVNQMIANVRKVYANETWKIKRLVVTEGNTAYRVGSAYYAQQSDVVKALQIHDNGDRHPRHKTHECFEYARADEFGMGAGIYPPTEEKIFSPHPQCSSYLTYVLDEDLPEGVDAA
jgi:adenine-specific DNA methylase